MAITGSILLGLGFSPLAASGLSLIANTAPVAYGALGTPIQGLASVTGLDPYIFGAMVGRQLPVFSLIVPFWVVWAFAGWKGMKDIWPAILVTGVSFANAQTTQNGTISEKTGNCRPDHRTQDIGVETGHRGEALDRRAKRAVRDRRRVGDQRETGSGERGETEAEQNRTGDRPGVPNPDAPSKKAPNENAIGEVVQPAVFRHAADSALRSVRIFLSRA